jgi:RNA recognition motif-containing protein
LAVRLFIGNLPYSASEADLRAHFAPVAEPSHVAMPVDRETGRPRGFAFVEFVDRAKAEEVIRKFDAQPFQGRPLAVSEARAPRGSPAASPRVWRLRASPAVAAVASAAHVPAASAAAVVVASAAHVRVAVAVVSLHAVRADHPERADVIAARTSVPRRHPSACGTRKARSRITNLVARSRNDRAAASTRWTISRTMRLRRR